MFAVALLVVLGLIEYACIRSTRRSAGGLTMLVHVALTGAMVAMLLMPGFVIPITVAVLAILTLAAGERIGRRGIPHSCNGQLIACSSSTLAILLLMMMTSAEPGPATNHPMPGMPAGRWNLSAEWPIYLASAVLVIFVLRASVEAVRAVHSRKSLQDRALHHGAAVAGSLSMVVMCAAMGAF